MVTIKVDGDGYLDAYIRSKNTGQVIVPDLVDDRFIYPRVDYMTWDGRDSQGVVVESGEYEIVCNVREGIGTFPTDTAIVEVTVGQKFHKLLATHRKMSMPHWSPDGTSIVYMADDDDNLHGVITKLDLSSMTETVLTAEDLGNGWPSWSPTGDKIAWGKVLLEDEIKYPVEIGIFMMDPDGSNKVAVSDTGAAGIYEFNPRWTPCGEEISYIKRIRSPTRYFINKRNLESSGVSTIFPPATDRSILLHSWSSMENKIALSLSEWNSFYHVYTYDIEDDFRSQVTFDDEEGADEEKYFEWSPDNKKIAFLEKTILCMDQSWGVLTVPSGGGTKIPVGGLASDYDEIYPWPGLTWSPDGTKIAIVLKTAIDSVQLICVDYIRNDEDAFPAAYILTPLANSAVEGIVPVVGTAADNISVNGDNLLSDMSNYRIEYGKGLNPATWNTYGVELSTACDGGDCQIVNDTLALWNTGVLESGHYTIRLVACDGVDSNVVYRHVNVSHERLTVKVDGTGDFTSIQAAVASAKMGDTVLVWNGEYGENIVMKETLHLKGAGDSVRIVGGNDTAIRISGHEYPCEIKGISIYNDGYYPNGRGILINDASPVIRNCSIRHNGSDNCTFGGGVDIAGDSYPKFIDCVISENRAFAGGGIKVNAREGETPAPSFIDCRIEDNEAGTGGGFYIYYPDETPLDTTYKQPGFSRCRLSNNFCKDYGSATAIYNCHAPVFYYCEISSNENKYNYGEPVYGYHSGGRFYNCSIVDNEVDEYGTAIRLGWSQLEYGGLKLERCIVAFNAGDPLIDNDHYDIGNSCFFGNSDEDTLWESRGEGNIVADPSFCDRVGGEYALYCFSPCASNVSGAGQIGACGIGCVPPCDTLGARVGCIHVCPAGDWDSLVVVVDLKDSVMTRDIDSTEIVLLPPYWEPVDGVRFFTWGPLFADSAATGANNWHTTITHRHMACCGDEELTVLLDGEPIEEKAYISVNSPDGDGSGGVVLGDLGQLGITYNKCPGDSRYDACFDFIGDSCVTIQDLGKFSLHYQHEVPDTAPPAMPAYAGVPVSDMKVRFLVGEGKDGAGENINVTVFLENVKDLSVLCLVLDNNDGRVEFIEWVPNPEFPVKTVVTPVERDGEDVLFIVALGGNDAVSGNIMDMGTLVLESKSNEGVPCKEKGFSILIGDLMTSDGRVWTLDDVKTEKLEDIVPLTNRLAGNYPNPSNPETVIEYSIAEDSHVSLCIYNVNGQLVRALVDEYQKGAEYRVTWDGKNDGGMDVASGVYFYRLKADSFVRSKKLILLR